MVTDVSKVRGAFISRVKQFLSTSYHNLEDLNLYKRYYNNFKSLNMRLLSSCYSTLAQQTDP
jgi:hypothetical protein